MTLSAIICSDPANATPTSLFVALHGWGANAEDLATLTPLLNLPRYQFWFPDAPFPHPQVPGGRMWYDLDKGEGLDDSRQQLHHWLASLPEQTGIPLQQVILAGFSQGGAMALDVGLQLPVAGLISLSGYLHPLADATPNPALPPILIIHGRQDPVVPLQAAQIARETLTQAGAKVQYQEFDMGHEIRPEVLTTVQTFVESLGKN